MPAMSPWACPSRISGLLGGEWYALDGEENQIANGNARPDAHNAERQERARAGRVRRVYVEEVGHLELRDHADHERRDRHDGHDRDREHHLERLPDAVEVDANKD